MGTQIEKEDIRLETLDDELFIAGCIDGIATKASLRTLGTGTAQSCAGDDTRLSDDRTASGIRTATTVVDVDGATAPTAGQVLTASAGDAAAWADLPDSLDPDTIIENEVPSGTKNGTNKDFTLANTPVTGTVKFYKNGLRMTPTVDFTVSGTTVTLVKAPKSADTLLVDYRM